MLSAPVDCTLKFPGLSAQERTVSTCMGYGHPEKSSQGTPRPV